MPRNGTNKLWPSYKTPGESSFLKIPATVARLGGVDFPGGDGVIQRIREASPRLRARLSGVFCLLADRAVGLHSPRALLTSRLLYAAGLIPVASFAVVTLLLCLALEAGEQEPRMARCALQPVRTHAGGPQMALPGREHRPRVSRALLSSRRLPRFPVGLPASNLRRVDGRRRPRMAYRSVSSRSPTTCPRTT